MCILARYIFYLRFKMKRNLNCFIDIKILKKIFFNKLEWFHGYKIPNRISNKNFLSPNINISYSLLRDIICLKADQRQDLRL